MTSLHLFDQWCSSSSIRAAATSFFSTDYDTMRCTKVFPSQNHQTFNYDPHSLLSDATLTATSDGMAASLGIKTPLSTHNKSSKKNWERKKISKGAECRNSAPNKSLGTVVFKICFFTVCTKSKCTCLSSIRGQEELLAIPVVRYTHQELGIMTR